MVKIKISKQAQKDMRQIYDYVSDTSFQNADKLNEKFITKIDSLKNFPERGKIVKEFADPALREISVYKFRIIYKLGARVLHIVSIHHSSRLLTNNPFYKRRR